MTIFDYQEELDFAKQLMATCAIITQSVQERHIDAQQKEDRTPVTIADYAVQAFIAKAIQDRFPGDVLVGEESSNSLIKDKNLLAGVVKHLQDINLEVNADQVGQWIDSGKGSPTNRFWVLDPVDGTKGFLRRMQYVTALALIENGEVQIGVIGCPNLQPDFYNNENLYNSKDISLKKGGIAFAGKGSGAWWQAYNDNSEVIPLYVSKEKNVEQVRIIRSYEDGHTNRQQIENFSHLAGIGVEPVRMDSQAKYVLLAGGSAELLLRLPPDDMPDYRENIWDQAPAYRIVLESGGMMTDMNGQPLDFTCGVTLSNNRGIVASNGWVHEKAIELLTHSI